ncbi:MAG: glycosyltransferase [Dechloromonas sp.]|uniref:Glycosyltransferase n=1 Tax=Candidatus Dechloromonas phosphorivorans TaxID=2899244 RepID=A0A935MRI8_9RHOO|nr:glycosyltransferase [Candidatus Dechloromonas phosphorivorans]
MASFKVAIINASHAPQPLSVAIITLNAASQLEDCLKSMRFVDDIVVIDSGSTDGTGAGRALWRACHRPELVGFWSAKQFAVDSADHDWVLCLDADERVSPELQASIKTR